ncbi:MAG: ABC transporter permease [Bacilli bacterium]|jgi:ABC-type transport system involved in multi-copper enzyme maturation permease subunit|nr:ABC transporter permease [Bacilli bacterium]
MSEAIVVPAKESIFRRLRPLVRMDFYRLFHSSLFFIMTLISAIIPVLVLTMVPASSSSETSSFTNVWQVIESPSGSTASLFDFSRMCNLNMLYIFVGILVAIFVSHDYSSGYIKNIFTVHARKADYVISKTLIGLFSGTCMLLAYVAATLIVGAIVGKSFDLGTTAVYQVILCLLSKTALMGVFVPLYLAVAVLFKNRLWLTILFTFVAGILFYPVASLTVSLNATALTWILSLAGGLVGCLLIGAVSSLILNRRDLA